jgi:hypothetical protein
VFDCLAVFECLEILLQFGDLHQTVFCGLFLKSPFGGLREAVVLFAGVKNLLKVLCNTSS